MTEREGLFAPSVKRPTMTLRGSCTPTGWMSTATRCRRSSSASRSNWHVFQKTNVGTTRSLRPLPRARTFASGDMCRGTGRNWISADLNGVSTRFGAGRHKSFSSRRRSTGYWVRCRKSSCGSSAETKQPPRLPTKWQPPSGCNTFATCGCLAVRSATNGCWSYPGRRPQGNGIVWLLKVVVCRTPRVIRWSHQYWFRLAVPWWSICRDESPGGV